MHRQEEGIATTANMGPWPFFLCKYFVVAHWIHHLCASETGVGWQMVKHAGGRQASSSERRVHRKPRHDDPDVWSGMSEVKSKNWGHSSRSISFWFTVALVLASAVWNLVLRSFSREPSHPDAALLHIGMDSEDAADGAAMFGVYLHDFEGTGRGLAAARDFAAGEVVIQVPIAESFHIGKHSLPVTFALPGRNWLPGGDGEKQKLVLALLIERDRGEDSPWQRWIEAQPVDVPSQASLRPLHRRALNGTDVSKLLKTWDLVVQDTMAALRAAHALFVRPPTVADVEWALAIVESRAHMHVDGEWVLWPHLTLANHHWSTDRALEYHTVADQVSEVARTQLRTRVPLKRGDQVFLHYGAISNLRLLVQYGFIMQDNPFLEPTPVTMIQQVGHELFKFTNLPGGPACGRIAQETEEVLRRTRMQEAGLPDLMVDCWRLARQSFAKRSHAMSAVHAGAFVAGSLAYAGVLQPDVVTRDVETYREIAVFCESQRAQWENPVALEALHQNAGRLSTLLLDEMRREAESWGVCVHEMRRRATSLEIILETQGHH